MSVTVADLGRLAAASLLADEQVGAEVVCLVFVRTPEGGYLTASAQQCMWPEMMSALNRRGVIPRRAGDSWQQVDTQGNMAQQSSAG